MTEINEMDLGSSCNSARESQDNYEFGQTVRKFESSYVRVPFEQFRRAFRLEMRIAEKDLPGLEALFKKHLSEGSGAVSENVLKALRERVRALEERLREYRGESQKFRERFLKRMKWTETMAGQGNYRTWSRGRLLRLIGDFLLKRGEIGLVREIGEARPELDDEFDTELEEMRRDLLGSLERRELGLLLQWCADHRSNLKRIESDLEFRLRRQEFIELLRRGDLPGALKCSQKHFSQWLESNYPEIRESLALICWLPFIGRGVTWSNGRMSKYEDLFDDKAQWKLLQDRFAKDFVAVYQLDDQSQLIKIVKVGLSALKTRQCRGEDVASGDNGDSSDYVASSDRRDNVAGRDSPNRPTSHPTSHPISHPTTNTNNSECPACTGPLKQLAKQLPYGHFEQTKLRCRLTGRLMTSNDPPMALPNGQVYSESGLRMLAGWKEGGTVVKCPVTGNQFLISEARKCFFL